MKTANDRTVLLVIDVQESFRRRPYWRPEDLQPFLTNTQSLIDRCRERGIPVLQIFHQEPWENSSDPFHPASGHPNVEKSCLGLLVKQKRKARIGRNPATGEEIKIPAKTVLKFRVAKAAKDAVLGATKK